MSQERNRWVRLLWGQLSNPGPNLGVEFSNYMSNQIIDYARSIKTQCVMTVNVFMSFELLVVDL